LREFSRIDSVLRQKAELALISEISVKKSLRLGSVISTDRRVLQRFRSAAASSSPRDKGVVRTEERGNPKPARLLSPERELLWLQRQPRLCIFAVFALKVFCMNTKEKTCHLFPIGGIKQ
jgi:hypothetical protein